MKKAYVSSVFVWGLLIGGKSCVGPHTKWPSISTLSMRQSIISHSVIRHYVIVSLGHQSLRHPSIGHPSVHHPSIRHPLVGHPSVRCPSVRHPFTGDCFIKYAEVFLSKFCFKLFDFASFNSTIALSHPFSLYIHQSKFLKTNRAMVRPTNNNNKSEIPYRSVKTSDS